MLRYNLELFRKTIVVCLMDHWLSPHSMQWLDVGVRISGALFCSLALGIERFIHRKPVDFRPFVIVSVAACALVIGLLDATQALPDARLSIDPGRVISGVMTGIGFLGAGALFRERHIVQGAGSAAAIWAAGAIGITCGLGAVWLGIIIALVILALFLIGRNFTNRYDARLNDDADQDQP